MNVVDGYLGSLHDGIIQVARFPRHHLQPEAAPDIEIPGGMQ
jgi:hypothetical protein